MGDDVFLALWTTVDYQSTDALLIICYFGPVFYFHRLVLVPSTRK